MFFNSFLRSSLQTHNRTTITLPSTSDIYNLKWNKTWGGSDGESGGWNSDRWLWKRVYYGGTSSYGAGGGDVFLLKYNSSGDLLWFKTWGALIMIMDKELR